jgi:mannose-6-phosphate isomerase
MKWYPLRFRPIYKQRVWGGDRLAELYARQLPAGGPIGESWEISDRLGDSSVVAEGELAGRTLSELVRADPVGLLGSVPPLAGRFPLLVKILDARDVLSLQVHPPASRAAALGGEPKTEMWYFTQADPGAEILVGLRRGTTRAEFERRLEAGTVAECFHRIPVHEGDAMFLPSGRVHALGAGLVLFEIQENSDTTYRVFDWNRVGLDGKPRPLHIAESLESIDFEDFAPGLLPAEWSPSGETTVRPLVRDRRFYVEARRGSAGAACEWFLRCATVLGVVRGRLEVRGATHAAQLGPGDFCLIPAALGALEVAVLEQAEWISAEPDGRE